MHSTSRTSPPRTTRVESVFALDLRSLAVFRIGLGLAVTYEACRRVLGFAPPPDVDPGRLVAIEWVLLPLGILLVLGLKTTLVSATTWFLLALEIRHRLLTPNVGLLLEHYVLTLGMFWGMLLPIGKRFSLDSRAAETSRHDRVLSVATVGLAIQIFLIYFSAGITKNFREWIFDRTALMDVLSRPHHASPFGQSLTGFPDFLQVASVLVVFAEIGLPLLLLLPGKRLVERRIGALALLAVFHVAMGLTMNLRMFPVTMIVMLTCLIPYEAWEARAKESLSPARLQVDRSPLRAAVGVGAIGVTLISNYVTWMYFPAESGFPHVIQTAARWLALYQQWVMYSAPSTL